MGKDIKKRLESLRKAMKDEGISAYYITTADFHNSEYVSDYFKVREYFSGFTGSNGNLLVEKKKAILWTDGRYFVQAEHELEGSGIELYKMGEEGVPDIYKYLRDNLGKKDVFGFDGRTIVASIGKKFKEIAEDKGFSIKSGKDITCDIFKRPDFPASRAEVLSDELTGESVSSKLERLREKIREGKAESLLITRLEDIMYLFNIRGNDIKYNPVLMSYAYISEDVAVIFLQPEAVTQTLREHLDQADCMILDYGSIEKYLSNLQPKTCVMIDPAQVNYSIYKRIKKNCKVIPGANPTVLMKAVRNETELKHMEDIFLKDSAALTKFILYLKKHIGDEEFTEMSAAELLLKYRKEIPEFRDLSFETISAYKENAAMMHYEPGNDHEVKLKPEGMLLVDSGGQYNGGTTDVTRTIALGDVTDKERRDYTLTACSMLNLMNLRFMEGCTGRNLDIIARKRMWDEGMDYKCGTGHGVGYMLSVHEGPHNLRWQKYDNEAVLQPGMCVTDEPGVYKKDEYGIRIENLLIVEKDIKTADGQFLKFKNLTFVPLDDSLIDRSIMTETEIRYYEDYQKAVITALEPLLSDEEISGLKEYCFLPPCR